jgi:molybdopterin synthase catalytic subunit
MSNLEESVSFSEILLHGDKIILTDEHLDEKEALHHVRKAEAGASVLFVGTTRNEFNGA